MLSPSRYLQKSRILIVDTDEQGCSFLRRMLFAAGIPNELTACKKADEAELLLSTHTSGQQEDQIGLVFMNLDLPDSDALHLLKRMREHGCHHRTAVIGLTASLDQQGAAAARELGADAVLEKYPGPNMLRNVTSRALRERLVASSP